MIETEYLTRLFVGLLIGVAGLSASPLVQREERAESTMDSIDQRVAEKFTEFEKTWDPAFVYQALDSIEAAESNMPVGDAAARKLAVSRRLGFFAALDRNIDPTWDPKNVPVLGVPAPLSHGMVYSSGEVDPSTIADPAARTEYEKALKANKDENQRYSVQLQLRRIDERAMRFTERLLADRYTNSEEDRQEFEELLAASPVNEVRKERLRALMPKAG